MSSLNCNGTAKYLNAFCTATNGAGGVFNFSPPAITNQMKKAAGKASRCEIMRAEFVRG